MKLAPNIVSGLVVKTAMFSFSVTIEKSSSHPFDFPIQLVCIVLTFSGQPFNFVRSSKSSEDNLVILKNH